MKPKSFSQTSLYKIKTGYARISTKDQNLQWQIVVLKKAGCESIFIEIAWGTKADETEAFYLH